MKWKYMVPRDISMHVSDIAKNMNVDTRLNISTKIKKSPLPELC